MKCRAIEDVAGPSKKFHNLENEENSPASEVKSIYCEVFEIKAVKGVKYGFCQNS